MGDTVLLINPPIHDFAAYDLFNKPLGLLYLASRLRSRGYDVRLIDCLDRNFPALTAKYGQPRVKPDGTGKYHRQRIEKPPCLRHIPRNYYRHGLPVDILTETLLYEFHQHPPAAVLVTSMMTYWYPAVADTISLVRDMMPDVPVGLGGVYAALMPQHARAVCKPDALFVGSALKPVLRWLADLTGPPDDDINIDESFKAWPCLAYDLYHHLDYLSLITSVGCPFQCDYCASSRLQPTLQQLEPARFVEQLLTLLPLVSKSNHHHNITLMDDALLARAEDHIVPLLEAVGRLDLPLRFHCPNGLHARFVTPEIAELMHANEFQMVRLSYEASGADSTAQTASDGKISDRLLRRAVTYLDKAGFSRHRLQAYILTGLPGQSMAEIERSAAAGHDLGVQLRLCQYSPIPGTALFDAACREFGIAADEPLLHNNTLMPCLDAASSLEDFQEFKHRVNAMNRELSHGKTLN